MNRKGVHAKPVYAFWAISAGPPFSFNCFIRFTKLTADGLIDAMLRQVHHSRHEAVKGMIRHSDFIVPELIGSRLSLDELLAHFRHSRAYLLRDYYGYLYAPDVRLVPRLSVPPVSIAPALDEGTVVVTGPAQNDDPADDIRAIDGASPPAPHEVQAVTASHSPAAASTTDHPTASTGFNGSTDAPNTVDCEVQVDSSISPGEKASPILDGSINHTTPIEQSPAGVASPAVESRTDLPGNEATSHEGDSDQGDEGDHQSCCQLCPNGQTRSLSSPDERQQGLEASEERGEGRPVRSVASPQNHQDGAEGRPVSTTNTEEAVASNGEDGQDETAQSLGSGNESTLGSGSVGQRRLDATCRYGIPTDRVEADSATLRVLSPVPEIDEDQQKLQRIKTRDYLRNLESDDRNTTASTRLLRIIRDEGVAPASQLGLKLLDLVQALRIDGELGPARMDERTHAIAAATVQPIQQRLDQFAEMLDHIAFACGVNVVEPDENGDTPAVTPRPSETPLPKIAGNIESSDGKEELQGGLEAVVELQPAQRELLDVLASPRRPTPDAGDNDEEGAASLDESGHLPLARYGPATALTPKQQLKRVLGAAQGMQDALPATSPYTRIGNQVLPDPASSATPAGASPRTVPPSRVHQHPRPELAGYNLSRNYSYYPHGPGFSYPHHASHPAWTSHERRAMPSPFSGEPAPARASPLHPGADSYARRPYARRSYHMWHSSHFGPRTTHPGGMQSAGHPSPYGHPAILPGAGVEHGFQQAFPGMPHFAASDHGGMYSYMP